MSGYDYSVCLTFNSWDWEDQVKGPSERGNQKLCNCEIRTNIKLYTDLECSLFSSIISFHFSVLRRGRETKQVVSRWERHLPGIHHLQKCLGLDGENRETLVCYFYKQIFNLSNNFLTDPWDTKLSDPLVWLLNYPWSSQPGLRKSQALSRSL